MLLASVATTQLTVYAFSSYTQFSYIGMVFTLQVYNLPMFGWVYEKRVFPMAMMAVLLLQVLYMVVSAVLRGRKEKKEKEKTKGK
jgi:hypothetical protein